MFSKRSSLFVLGSLVFCLALLLGCRAEPGETDPTDQAAPTAAFDQAASDDQTVTLNRSSTTWETYAYQLTDFNTIKPGSFDGKTKQVLEFETWVLENEYLKVTLLPEYGGRILSILYKPTGHEELYQNPLGVPYQIDTNVFYYNWLMVYGGIFPTFPEPEHGKSWFMPWEFEVVALSEHAITVAMSYLDDGENKLAPYQYDTGVTGLRVTYFITLQSGRTALETVVQIENPGDEPVWYEYWTNTTLAPGSDPAQPQTTANAEIIVPVNLIKIPAYWYRIASQEQITDLENIYEFQKLRVFGNWPDMGIAYAYPDLGQANFWGVINQDNQEGIFRIADNSLTPGLKIWTWGYPQTAGLDPQTTSNEARPYIELWAGLTTEFWQRTEIEAAEKVEIKELYSPSVGLSNVSHANQDFLVNLGLNDLGEIECQLFALSPERGVTVQVTNNGTLVLEESLVPDPLHGNQFSVLLPEGDAPGLINLRILDADSSLLLNAQLEVPSAEPTGTGS